MLDMRRQPSPGAAQGSKKEDKGTGRKLPTGRMGRTGTVGTSPGLGLIGNGREKEEKCQKMAPKDRLEKGRREL